MPLHMINSQVCVRIRSYDSTMQNDTFRRHHEGSFLFVGMQTGIFGQTKSDHSIMFAKHVTLREFLTLEKNIFVVIFEIKTLK